MSIKTTLRKLEEDLEIMNVLYDNKSLLFICRYYIFKLCILILIRNNKGYHNLGYKCDKLNGSTNYLNILEKLLFNFKKFLIPKF